MSTIKSSDEHLTLNADGNSKDIKFQANGVEKASISSSGAFTSTSIDATKLTSQLPSGIGIGVTPVSDNTLMQSVELGAGSAITGYKTSGSPNTYLTNNVKFNSSAASLYKATDEASRIVMDSSGKFYFDVAASGTANGAISWTTAMTIDNNGRVIQHKKIYSIYKSYGGGVGDLTGGTLVDSEGITFSTSTGKWTAPIAGLYQMGGSFYTDGDTTMEVYIKKNGSSTAFLNNLTSNRNSFGYSVSTIMYLAANDTVNFANLKGSIRSATGDYRWIFRIG